MGTVLGLFIKTQRERLGMTKLTLSRLSGLSDSHIGQIERGEYLYPKEETLIRLSKALFIDKKVLLELSKKPDLKVGERVRHYRNQRNLTQYELERMSGLSKGHICKIERNKRKDLEEETLQKIAHALSVNLQDLLQPLQIA